MTDCNLADQTCIPCRGDTPPLSAEAAQALLARLGDSWVINAAGHLERSFSFDDFASALAFTNQIGAEAEHAGHHPDLYLAWGRCRVEIWTHKINGLAEADFILAAKASRAYAAPA
jgi:4a-hydroxytetrahydrobiopterin dehydratase